VEWITGIHWGYWVLFGICAYIFCLPLLLLNFFRIESNPTLQLLDPDELPLPPIVQQHLDAVETDLNDAGFEPVGTLLLPRPLPNACGVLRVYVNRATRESAMATSMFGLVGERVNRHIQYVEFTTRYADGRVFNTLNSKEAGSLPFPSHVSTTRIPWATEVAHLYRLHRTITTEKGPAGPKVLRLDANHDGDVVGYIQSAMREELEYAASAGYLRLIPSGSHYWPTIRGAYLMTWQQLPPFKQLLAAYDRRRVKDLLAQIGAA
jgi:hypothetical protein